MIKLHVLRRWAKLCMVMVGGLGLFFTRTLYDEQTLQVPCSALHM